MTGITQVILITRQHFGQIPTFCNRCRKQTTFKITSDDGSYTKKCDCGCSIFSYHRPDKNHITAFYTTVFIPASKFDPTYKNKDAFEKEGFKKIETKNGPVYQK